MSKTSDVELRVAGVTFRTPYYPSNLHELATLLDQRKADAVLAAGEADLEVALPVVLRRNPANEHDANAIEVHVPALGRGPKAFIGFIPAARAEGLAPRLDAGEPWKAWLTGIYMLPDKPEQPGAELLLRQVQTAAT